MSTDLKAKTTISLIWNGIDKVGYQVIAMLVGIITARLLTPTDFGYIAALAIFTAISNTLVESGFTSAMVRRKENSDSDYTTAFFFNVALSVVFYIALYFAAPAIADYYNMPPLVSLARVIFIAIIINAFVIIPNIILTRQLRFKDMTSANLIGVVVSSVITVAMALAGYGYWAIAAQQISQVAVKAIILIVKSGWRPVLRFNFSVIVELFSFSALLIVSALISNSVRYIYNFYIGPRYPSSELGYYGQSFKFQNILSTVVSTTMTGVAYPVISSLNDDKKRQMAYFQKIVRITAFVMFPVAIGMIVISPNFISVILTDKWLPMNRYFQLLLMSSVVVPFINIFTSYCTAIGRPRLLFYMELVRNALIVLFLFVFNDSISSIIYGYIISSYLALLIDAIVVANISYYRFIDQIKHITPPILLSFVMAIAIYFVGSMPTSTIIIFLLQIVVGIVVYFGLAILFRMQIIADVKEIIKKK